ncbi:CC157 protein, partial [Bucco capensis]|nr:CC157 protein [Bucco capensis]
RLLLLLQSFTHYSDELQSERAMPPAQPLGPSMSVGLTARRYWASMLKMGALYQQLLAEKKACKKEVPPQPSTSCTGNPEKQQLKPCLPAGQKLRTSPEVAQPSSLCPAPSVHTAGSEAVGSSQPRAAPSSVPTQVGTRSPPGPCAACASAQANLREVGKAITSICQSHNIPSALSKFQAAEESTGRKSLSASDMSYWASEQSKDLSRISKHLQMLLQQVKPLKAELEESEKQKEELRKQIKDFSQLLQAEKETQAQQRKEAESRLEAKNKEHSEAVARLEQDKDDLRKVLCLSPEVTKTSMMEEMRTTMVARSQMIELEEKVQLLTDQHESRSQELSTTTIQLEKEKARVESMLRYQESLQAKQKELLQHLDSLDQEREELQASLGEAEEDKARLAEQLQESQEQSRQQLQAQQANVSKLEKQTQELEKQTQELKERERLLVVFPELHSPVETLTESTGSVIEDMEKQVQANSIRINVLEEENIQLRSALATVKAAAEKGVLKFVPQSQLWPQLSSLPSEEPGRPDAGESPKILHSPNRLGDATGTAMPNPLRQQAQLAQHPLPLP